MAHQPAQATLLQINLRSTAPVGARLTLSQRNETPRNIPGMLLTLVVRA